MYYLYLDESCVGDQVSTLKKLVLFCDKDKLRKCPVGYSFCCIHFL